MTEKKVLFLDMDGTTLNDQHEIPEDNLSAIKAASEAGHDVVITTGRPEASARNLMKKYRLDQAGCRYIIANNGGTILDYRTEEILFSTGLPLPWVRELIQEARRQDVFIQTYAGEKVVAEKENEGLDYYAKKNGMERLVVPDIMAVLEREPGKVLLIDMHDRSRLEKYKNSMEEWGRDKVEMYFSSREFLEVVPKGINKENAVRAYCDMFHIPAANTVAAGDEQNDLPMILAAGVGCAAANAVDEVKAGADYVTENDNNHSAVAEIIRKFMLS